MNRETNLMNLIRIELADIARLHRINVGTWKTKDGRFVSSGVPKGFSDLFGVRVSDGRAIFIEVKTETGKATPEQINFLRAMQKANALTGIARSVAEARAIVEGER